MNADKQPRGRGGLLRWVAGIAITGTLVAVAIGIWFWCRTPRLEPPSLDLAQVDPEIAEAITAARQQVLDKPSSGPAWGRLGTVLWVHDYGVEALACLAQAERLEPREPRWPYFRGLTLLRTDPAAGIACLQRAAERCGDADPLAPRLRLAEALLDTGRLDEADLHLQKAVTLDPDNARAHLDRGRLAMLRKDWRTALKDLTVCVADRHARRLAFRLRAQVYRRLGEREHAEGDEGQAGKLPEDEPWPDLFAEEATRLQRGLSARLTTADILRRAGQLDEALAILEETAKKYPTSTRPWLHLAEIWHGLGRIDQAEQACRQAVRGDPDAAQAWFWLGVFQALKNRPREAVESFRRAIHLKPDYAMAHFCLGQCLSQLDDAAGAAKEYRLTLRCRPDYAPARAALEELSEKRTKTEGPMTKE